MEKEKIFQKQEVIDTSKIEILADGDVYNINCLDESDLSNKIAKIAKSFDEPEFVIKEIIEEVLNNKDWRFEGTYNLRRKGNKLTIDNRNGRGVKENREKLKMIIKQL
jgi:hypothetical protein